MKVKVTIIEFECDTIVIDPHGAMMAYLNDTVPSAEDTPEEVMEKFDDWCMDTFGLTRRQLQAILK